MARAREATQRCQVCGRKFVMRAERVCSRECLAKLEAKGRGYERQRVSHLRAE
jgi:hypothetical protein